MAIGIGDILLQKGMISEEQLQQALDKHRNESKGLASCLLSLQFVTEIEFLKVISEQFEVPIIELDQLTIDVDVAKLIPNQIAVKYGMLPVSKKEMSLTLAMSDPSNILAVNEVRFITGLELEIVLASPLAIEKEQEKIFSSGESIDSILQDIEGVSIENPHEEDVSVDELTKATEDAPVVKLVNAILMDAIKKRASDIHIEPYEKVFRTRFRIDGVLYEIMRPPIPLKNAIISRLKIISGLDISERRLPQDGRIKLKLAGNKEMDFRVNVLPTLFGEKVVMRLLDKSNLQLDMTKLGFYEAQLGDFKESINRPFGMVLVTGPTGSGKTTTLYSALSDLNKDGVNISTAEDPVEFNLMGINQAQMHDDIGFNFASALRAFLRQDPDIIMVGEIRDYETAEIAIKASLTGHLVLSTLHTNDAPATVSRLLNMGVEPFLVASSINVIVAQRLARRVCGNCAEEVQVNPEVLVSIGIPAAEAKNLKVRSGKGCDKCSGTGYKGRVALYEVLAMKEELKECILSGASTSELKREAIRLGMLTLRASALLRLREGVTTVEEVARCTVPD